MHDSMRGWRRGIIWMGKLLPVKSWGRMLDTGPLDYGLRRWLVRWPWPCTRGVKNSGTVRCESREKRKRVCGLDCGFPQVEGEVRRDFAGQWREEWGFARAGYGMVEWSGWEET